MATESEKKEFALSQLAPYLKDPKTCGYNKDTGACEYLTKDNKMCVAGKNMIKPKFGLYRTINDVLSDNQEKQEGIFKPEVVGVLSNLEWRYMQSIHDTIATHSDFNENNQSMDRLKIRIERLNLFTYQELLERANSIE